jgi:hypothetical protein
MAQYTDLYLRNTLKDTGNVPRQGAMSSSPDIIPWGTDLQIDPPPQTYFSGNYNTDPGRGLIADAWNYLYLRSKNLGSNPSTGDAYLYWAPSSLLLYPDQWKVNAMTTSSGAKSVKLNNVAAQAIGVTTDPFKWQPAMPGGNFHYCLIGRVATEANPNPIPNTGDIQDFAAWVAANGGIGWRNVSVVSAGSPQVTLSANYDQGAAASDVNFQAVCTGCPLKQSWVQFSSGTPLPDGKYVSIPKTLIESEGQIIGVKRTVPAGWKTTFNINYWANANPLPGWNIDVYGAVVVEESQKALYALAHSFDEIGWGHAVHVDEKGVRDLFSKVMGPRKMIVIGEAVMRNGKGL